MTYIESIHLNTHGETRTANNSTSGELPTRRKDAGEDTLIKRTRPEVPYLVGVREQSLAHELRTVGRQTKQMHLTRPDPIEHHQIKSEKSKITLKPKRLTNLILFLQAEGSGQEAGMI